MEKQVFRLHLIYTADGMARPLSSRQDVPAETVREAVNLAENFISSAYFSGYVTLSWTAQNLGPITTPEREPRVGEVRGEAARRTLKALAAAKQARRNGGN